MSKRVDTERINLVSMLMIVLAFAACYISAVVVLTPKLYDVSIGSKASHNIIAPRTVVNAAATQALRDAAAKEVQAVYKLDESLVNKYSENATVFFQDINSLRHEAQALRSAYSGSRLRPSGELSVSEWQLVVSAAELQEMMQRFKVPVSADEGWWLLHVEENEILRFQEAVLPKLLNVLQSGVEERMLPAKKAALIHELNSTELSEILKNIGQKVLQECLLPTFVEDREATAHARASAAAAVAPVEIRRGDIIVREGDAVTKEQYAILDSLSLVADGKVNYRLQIGILIFVFIAFSAFLAYMAIYRRHVLSNNKNMLIVAVSIILTMALTALLNSVDYRISPALIGVMMVALLVEERTAMAVNIVLSFCIGLFSKDSSGSILGFDSMVMTATMLLGGQVVIYLLHRHHRRGTIVAAGLFSGIAAACMHIAIYLIIHTKLSELLIAAAWILGSNAVCAVLVVGSLSLWENLFDIATSARLNELSNANHPLLRQLMTEAPGTYRHSMWTAALAESAAEAIDADSQLARVGAYYHDVGKLRRPLYFKENQKPNENIHDTMPPHESASVIISHQKDGVALLNKHKLPSAVAQIAFEHHGTTLAAYFYHKAMEADGGKAPMQKNFRYPGVRPSTKESAIVFLADSCEAAVRALDNPTRETVESTVASVIRNKIDDGQLSASPLNFREISTIQQSFLRTFNGLLHDRIPYPKIGEA